MVQIRRSVMSHLMKLMKTGLKIKIRRGKAEYQGRERRSYPRVKCHSLVKCLYENQERCKWVANLKNISEDGLQLYTPKPMLCDDITQFVIHFGRWNVDMTVAARVIWKKLLNHHSQGGLVGLAFLDIDPFDQYFIRKYVHKTGRHSCRVIFVAPKPSHGRSPGTSSSYDPFDLMGDDVHFRYVITLRPFSSCVITGQA